MALILSRVNSKDVNKIFAVLLFALVLPLVSLGHNASTPSESKTVVTPKSVARARLGQLRRGINLSHWFSQSPGKYYSQQHLSKFMTAKDIALIKKIGFDHVRFPINARLFYSDPDPTHLDSAFVASLDASLDMILASGLSVIVDMHPDDDFKVKFRADDKHVEAFAIFWQTLATHLSRRDPEHVFLEILNEPMVEDSYRWTGIQARLAAAIRKGAPRHTIIATGGRWSSIEQLLLLEPLADGNVIYTFHFYEPHTFTHQSATWGAEYWQYLKNIPYPSNPEVISPLLPAIDQPSARAALKDYGEVRWDASKVERTIEVAADWARKHDVPLICNEFGVYRAQTPECSRLHWLKDVRTALERHGIGWAMWDYADGFGVAVRKNGEVVSDLQTEYALGLGKADVGKQRLEASEGCAMR